MGPSTYSGPLPEPPRAVVVLGARVQADVGVGRVAVPGRRGGRWRRRRGRWRRRLGHHQGDPAVGPDPDPTTARLGDHRPGRIPAGGPVPDPPPEPTLGKRRPGAAQRQPDQPGDLDRGNGRRRRRRGGRHGRGRGHGRQRRAGRRRRRRRAGCGTGVVLVVQGHRGQGHQRRRQDHIPAPDRAHPGRPITPGSGRPAGDGRRPAAVLAGEDGRWQVSARPRWPRPWHGEDGATVRGDP